MQIVVNQDKIRIDKYLSNVTEYSRSLIQKMIDGGYILVNNNNIKMVVHLREQAFLMTYTKNTTNDFMKFKRSMLENLENRFIQELKNHMSLEEAYNQDIK